MDEIREVVEVIARDDFTLECEMENGDVYEYDMSFILSREGEIFKPLWDINCFKEVWLDDIGALEWPSGLGIHGDTVVRDGTLISKKSVA